MRISATLSHGRPALRGARDSAVHRALSVIGGLIMKPVRFYRMRAEMNALGRLSDHELNDVGLSRSDIIAVTGLPLDIDPTAVLASMVEERRRWRRGF